MKYLFIALFSFIGFSNSEAVVDSKTVDTESSVINWTGYKVLGKHTGTLKVKEGSLDFEGEKLVGGKFIIDMSSMECTDLEGEMAGKLIGHLSSEDFFGVEKFPTSSLTFTKVVSRGKVGDYKITADLEIKGVTESIVFNAIVAPKSAEAKIEIDRSTFGIQYGSGSFFENLGDKTIYDEFDLEVRLALK